MAYINKLSSGNFQVQIRLKGLKPIYKTFSTKKMATDFARQVEGDTAALRMCLDRCIAPLRSTTQNIELDFEGELHERGEATLQAIYSGEIDPITGSALIGALADQSRLKEQTELEARLSYLESKL